MKEEVFQEYIGQKVRLTLKRNDFVLTGYIDAVFDDCLKFRTDQKTSLLNFDAILSVVPIEGGF